MSTLDDILRKVQAMIARADHPNTPPAEAETARAMAEQLMLKYRIDETILGQGKTGGGLAPQWREFPVARHGEFALSYRTIVSAVIDHLDIRGSFKLAMMNGESTWVAEVVGYESDVRFCEMLSTACTLAFGQRLEPKYDPTLSEQQNAYFMRMAGMEGRRIAMAIYGKDDKHLRPKVRKMFEREAVARGEDPRVLLGKGNSVKTFRKSYADGFVYEIYDRLRAMRFSRAAEGVVVLKSRKEAIDEAFYERYPHWRPKPVSGAIGETAASKPCPKCAKAKSGACRDHSYRRASYKQPKMNVAGYYRGQAAAKTVNLQGE